MKIRILSERKRHPSLRCGQVCDVEENVAFEMLQQGAAEPVRGVQVERAVAPPVAERATAPARAEWPLKTSPAEYLEQHADDEDPSELVAERIALARELAG